MKLKLRLLILAFAFSKTFAQVNNPPFWLIERNGAKVYILGYGEAETNEWLTPTIKEAFTKSSQLWLETPRTSDTKNTINLDSLISILGYDSSRTFFDALSTPVKERAIKYVVKYGVDTNKLKYMRPWLGYYTLLGKFISNTKRFEKQVFPEDVLREMAKQQNKKLQFEFESREAVSHFFAAMNDSAQSQYIQMLLDYIADEESGKNADSYDWIKGKITTNSIDRMRNTTPDLYQLIQQKRNIWWSYKIEELLSLKNTYFIFIGLNHVLGIDGIPNLLKKNCKSCKISNP